MHAHPLAAQPGARPALAVMQPPQPPLIRREGLTPGTEAEIAKLQASLLQVTLELAELKGRVSQLLSPAQTINIVLAVLAIIELSKYLLQ